MLEHLHLCQTADLDRLTLSIYEAAISTIGTTGIAPELVSIWAYKARSNPLNSESSGAQRNYPIPKEVLLAGYSVRYFTHHPS